MAELANPKALLPSPLAVLRPPNALLSPPLAVLPRPNAPLSMPPVTFSMPKALLFSPAASLSTPKALLLRPLARLSLPKAMLAMLLAVLHRHAGVAAFDQDVFINAVGGVKITEPAADLAVLLAIQSSMRSKPLPRGLVRPWAMTFAP